jgi:hypothetical protein
MMRSRSYWAGIFRGADTDERLEKSIDIIELALAESRKAAIEECAKVADEYPVGAKLDKCCKLTVKHIAEGIRSLLLPGQPAEQVKDGDVCNGQCGAIGGPHIHGGPATEIKP